MPPHSRRLPAALFHRLVLNAVDYFTSERDSADVEPSVINRQPANLTDQHAYVYASPRYDSNDNLLGKLHPVGGPVNVAGAGSMPAAATRSSPTPAATPTG